MLIFKQKIYCVYYVQLHHDIYSSYMYKLWIKGNCTETQRITVLFILYVMEGNVSPIVYIIESAMMSIDSQYTSTC